jgi:hypothetical protein
MSASGQMQTLWRWYGDAPASSSSRLTKPSAQLIGASRGHLGHPEAVFERTADRGQVRKIARSWALSVEPPIGIEPMAYALRGEREPSTPVQWVTPLLLTGFEKRAAKAETVWPAS